jgi:hypothetical protein
MNVLIATTFLVTLFDVKQGRPNVKSVIMTGVRLNSFIRLM